jgi:hypothetical protein
VFLGDLGIDASLDECVPQEISRRIEPNPQRFQVVFREAASECHVVTGSRARRRKEIRVTSLDHEPKHDLSLFPAPGLLPLFLRHLVLGERHAHLPCEVAADLRVGRSRDWIALVYILHQRHRPTTMDINHPW